MVGTGWRGYSILRQRVTPHNPQSAAQMVSRSYLQQAATNIRTTWTLQPSCKTMWEEWADTYVFPDKPTNMAAYPSCMKVSLALNQFDLYADLGLLPTTAPYDVPEDMVVTAADNELSIAWGAHADMPAGTEMQLWVCQLASPIRTANPKQARLRDILTIGTTSHAASVFYTWDGGGSLGSTASFCVWARTMKNTDAVPSTWRSLGQFELTTP